ncbi:MAG: hypothetical protein ABIN18_14395 [Pseudomonadota bacterium]
MKVKATLELDEATLEDLWRSYDLIDQDEAVVGKLYVRSDHLPPETIELVKDEVTDDD